MGDDQSRVRGEGGPVILLLGVGCAAVLVPLLMAGEGRLGGSALRRRDAGLVAAGVGVLGLPLVHIALLFVGFVQNPRHFEGDCFAMQYRSRVAALVIALALAAAVAAVAAIGASSRPHARWRVVVAIAEVGAAVAFVVVELSVGLPAIAEAGARLGTIPM